MFPLNQFTRFFYVAAMLSIALPRLPAQVLTSSPVSQLRFDHLSIEKGLPSPSANCVLQDSKGFIWIGTNDGLSRYDGYFCRVCKNDAEDSFNLGSNMVFSILEDREGNLWIGTASGLFLFDYYHDEIVQYLPEGSDPAFARIPVACLFQDSNGYLWAGTLDGRLYRCNPAEKERPWMAWDTGLQKFDRISSIHEDSRGDIWIGTLSGLGKLNPSEHSLSRYPLFVKETQTSGRNIVKAIFEDNNGVLWIGTSSGLFRMKKDENDGYPYELISLESQSNAIVSSITGDRNGNFWIATDGNGLKILNRKPAMIIHYMWNPYDPASLGDNNLNALYRNKNRKPSIPNCHSGHRYRHRYPNRTPSPHFRPFLPGG